MNVSADSSAEPHATPNYYPTTNPRAKARATLNDYLAATSSDSPIVTTSVNLLLHTGMKSS